MSRKKPVKRFSVSLEPDVYAELRRLAESQRPPLTFQYVIRYALQRFLDEHKGKQLKLDLS